MIMSYIINLDRNTERMEFMAQRFESLGLPYERFEAVNGKTITDENFQEFADARPRVSAVGKWTKSKMGCHMSHRSLWETIAHSNDPYTAIFEDDVIISDYMQILLTDDNWIPDECDIVKLESPAFMSCLLSKIEVHTLTKRKLHRILPNDHKNAFPLGAAAYIVKREAAQKIMDAPLDDFVYTDRSLFDHSTSGIASKLNSYQVNPACCIQDKFYHENTKDIVFNSDIETEDYKDIYQNQNQTKYLLRKYGSKVGLFQIFRLFRRLRLYVKGYRKIPYQK